MSANEGLNTLSGQLAESKPKAKAGDAFLDAIDCMNKNDHAVMVVVDFNEGASLIVERNKLNVCLKALVWRYLDIRNERCGYDAGEARKQVERIVGAWVREWEEEND